jgi:DNA-binding XRE family transcriptional regulator
MIRTETEYQAAVKRLDAERERINEQRTILERSGLKPSEVKRAIDPVLSFHLQLQEEVDSYVRIKRGDFREVENLMGMGRLLIGLRIYLGLSQRQLAQKLEIDESQVSRDERNEYRGISMERAHAILEALGVRLVTRVEPPEPIAELVTTGTGH